MRACSGKYPKHLMTVYKLRYLDTHQDMHACIFSLKEDALAQLGSMM